jgi:hypothetical protein
MTGQMSFQDVLDALMLEEREPSHEALLRWSQRYPQYRQALKEFFATWAIQNYRPDPEPDIDEESIVEEGVNRVMDTLRRQGRVISQQAVPALSEYDQLVLTAIYLLRGNGRPATITMKTSEMCGKQALLGSVFDSLNRLEARGVAVSRYPDPEDTTTRYFTVTMLGERALAVAKQNSTVIARFLADFAW